MARIWAENSYCTRRKVGALVVKENMIISDGYNGTPTGFENICEDQENNSKPYVLHAEANAITKLARSANNCDGATMYVTASPCIECAKLIIQSGISRVVYTEIGKYNICRMNMLNILSGRVQKLDSDVWSIDEMELRERIIRFIRSLADHHKGEKKLYIKMNDLAVLLDATRINVSRELNALQDQGLIELSRGGIRIPLLENLK